MSAKFKSKQKSSESSTDESTVYCTYNLQESIYLAVLKHWYYTFQMTVGNMTKLMNDNDPDHLRLMLAKFFNKVWKLKNFMLSFFLKTIELQVMF